MECWNGRWVDMETTRILENAPVRELNKHYKKKMWVGSRFRFSWFLKLFGSLMKSIVIALWHNCDPEPDLASDVHSLVMHDWTWQHYYKKGNFRVTWCLCFKKSLPVHIFKWIVLHVDSFWHWGIRHLSNGLLAQHNVNNNINPSVLVEYLLIYFSIHSFIDTFL